METALGMRYAKQKYTPILYVDKNMTSFAMAWENLQNIKGWMEMQKVEFPCFEINTNEILLTMLNSKSPGKLLFNHSPKNDESNIGILNLRDITTSHFIT